MQQFRTDNTEGYSASDLAELNLRFERELSGMTFCGDDTDKSKMDRVAARVLAKFDRERS